MECGAGVNANADEREPIAQPDPILLRRITEYIRTRRVDPTQEIEIRIGNGDPGGHPRGSFIPGTTQEAFEQLECDLRDAGLRTNGQWHEIVDYYYAMHKRGQNARTRVTTRTDVFEVHTEHMIKESHASLTTGTAGTSEICRISRARETKLLEPPKVCIPTHVRLQQRCVFEDVRDGNVVWSYDLSRTWSANTRIAVEEKIHQLTEPVYEVECELVDEGGLYIGARTDVQVASSLLLKAKLLLGYPSEELVFLNEHSVMDGSKKRQRHV